MAKKEVAVRELEEPLICQRFPHPPRCQGARCRQLMKSTRKCLKLLPLFWLHGNSLSLLNFTQCHLRRFSLGVSTRLVTLTVAHDTLGFLLQTVLAHTTYHSHSNRKPTLYWGAGSLAPPSQLNMSGILLRTLMMEQTEHRSKFNITT